MPNRSNRSSPQKELKKKVKQTPEATLQNPTQHGSLLVLPSESLTHVTATLDPKSLLALGQVNRRLRDHVSDDHTWAVAFKMQFMSLAVEADAKPSDTLLLRRTESTWRKEFLRVWTLHRRFIKSRNTTISHTPVNSSVSSFVLLPDKNSVLAASLTYGIVSRSFAFTGKILKGYLDAQGTLNGQGIGNPNAEFAPDVSVISLHSSGLGGSARVAWGFLNGDVALTTAPKVMELGKSAKFVRCRPADAHDGVVSALAFGEPQGSGSGSSSASSDTTFASASSRGSVKLWDSRRMRCLWSETVYGQLHPLAGPSLTSRLDPNAGMPLGVKCLAYCASSRTIVAACVNGDLHIWTGFQAQQATAEQAHPAGLGSTDADLLSPAAYKRVASLQGTASDSRNGSAVQPCHIAIEPAPLGSSSIHLAVFYDGQPHFWKVTLSNLGQTAGTYGPHHSITKFVAGPVGSLTSYTTSLLSRHHESGDGRESSTITPSDVPTSSNAGLLAQTMGGLLPFVPKRRTLGSYAQSYVLAGDSLGQLFAWDWDAGVAIVPPSSTAEARANTKTEVSASRQLTAHEDGAVTAIELDGPILVTGSAAGSINVWDALTFELLRTFAAPSARHPPAQPPATLYRVTQLALREDVLMASIGSRVYAWKAENTRDDKLAKGKGKSKRPAHHHRVNPLSKWQEQLELREELKDSRFEIDAKSTATKQTYGRQREERQKLSQMGLDEVEAVEYVLMLSRDEEMAKQHHILSSIRDAGPSTVGPNNPSIPSTSFRSDFVEEDLLFDLADDVDVNFPPPSPSEGERRRTQSSTPMSSAVSSRRTSSSTNTRFSTPIPSPRYSSSHASPSLSPTGSTKIQISPRRRPEPMEAGTSISASPLDLSSLSFTSGRSNVWNIPPRVIRDEPPSPREVGSGARNPSASLTDWTTGSISVSTVGSSRAPELFPTSSVSTSVRTTGNGSESLSTSGDDSAGVPKSWSSVARMLPQPSSSTIPTPALNRDATPQRPSGSLPSGSSSLTGAHATSSSQSLLSASLVSKRDVDEPSATPQPLPAQFEFESEEAELQYVLQLSLAEAKSLME